MIRDKSFTSILMQWDKNENHRKMPWKGEKDPYKVWVSEIILQQTRVEQGWMYYERFLIQFPDLISLAKAKDDDVFKLWEGLGYYSRCKNLIHTARYIYDNYEGKFPENYEDILSLKGIGPYTAAAIVSFCFNKPYAVLDGNVFRVLSRISGNSIPIDSAEGKIWYTKLADKLLDKILPGKYNQAIMDFGATICKPMLPLCAACPANNICVAYDKTMVNILPVKEKVLKKRIRWFSYFIIKAEGKVLVRKRTENDIWQNLFEYFLIETPANPEWDFSAISTLFKTQLGINHLTISNISVAKPQQLTHQLIKGYFVHLEFSSMPEVLKSKNAMWLTDTAVSNLPFPKFINEYFSSPKSPPALF
ncbi:A/G-specific adenine glycosylase [Limnovirga soli]|jgi:A/G-specific adenine glycosylase|uniref:Adenine DNA glycosylase n=1 Tax=Limnovirga soli TaxID=2656915 RepID=A0A8J8FHA1_9BACT|nr:A/G-specific adenine glycosylase [Limnovirga soli]NNV57083.1 A/G-specific adenine glycosylase [Limnovirga soli]